MNFRRATGQERTLGRRWDTKLILEPRRLFALALVVVVLTPAIEAVTEEPLVEDTVFAGRPALVAKPEGEGPWPALLFVNGTIREGRNYPPVQNLARGLDRGYPRATGRRGRGGKRPSLGRGRRRPVYRHPNRPQHRHHRTLPGRRRVRPLRG